MTKHELIRLFRSSIRRGTGLAYLLAAKHPFVDFSDEIIKACVKNFAYDGQCEESRAPYLFGLINLSQRKEKIRSVILNALATVNKDTWTLTQLFDLAKHFALQGDAEARQAIYNRFYTNPINGAPWAGYAEIIELDGLDGLLFIADKIGKALATDPGDWQDDMMVGHFQKNYPDTDGMELLRRSAVNNPDICRYFEEVERILEKRNEVRERPVYKDIVEEVLTTSWRFRRTNISPEETDLLARQLLIETNKENQKKLLAVFKKNKFPFDSGYLLDIAMRKPKVDKKTTGLAIDALSLLKSTPIRNFALEAPTTKQFDTLRIFKSNYKKGDAKLLAEFAIQARNEHDIEWLAIIYTDIFRSNKTPECKLPLEILYDKSPCGICRADIVKLLIANDVLSDRIKEELQFDCNEDTRGLLG